MHILLIHQAFTALDEPGGTRHYELACYLAERGHRITIIASPVSYMTGSSRQNPASPTQDHPPGMRILRAYTYPAWHRSFAHRMISFVSFMLSSFWLGMRQEDVDLVWGTSPPIFQGITAWALARLKRAPFLFEVRDLWPAFAVAVGVLRQPALIRASEWLERNLYAHADQIVVNSPGFIPHVRARGGDKVELIPNGADPAMFATPLTGEPFRRQHNLEGKFVALYAGAHGLSNDLQVILEAAALLQAENKIAFVLLGDGKEKPKLVKQAAEMGLRNVHFLSPVPKSEMPQALAAADACIAILKPIELYKTVYPNKVFDYMAAGKPVVLAIDGVIRSVVEEARAGVFVPPGNPVALAQAVQKLANDPEWGKQMGADGQEYVKLHFNRVKLAEQLARLIEGLSRPSQ